jgi:hypothetical protein
MTEGTTDQTDPRLNSTEAILGNGGTAPETAETGERVIRLPLDESVALEVPDDREDNHTEQAPEAARTKEVRLEQAEQWLGTQTEGPVPYKGIVDEATAKGEPVPSVIRRTDEPVSATIAPEIALLAQQRIRSWNSYDDLYPDDFGDGLAGIRDEAIAAAGELDFGVVANTLGFEWPLRVRLNAEHEKFTDVSAKELADYLGDGDDYEQKALYIRNIIADHAPQLLTTDLRVLLDPSQPSWRVAATHASILLRNHRNNKLDTYTVDRIPDALPVSDRNEYLPEDNEAIKPFQDMSDDELALYMSPQSATEARENGRVSFNNLNQPAKETLLARRFFELDTKSSDPTFKAQAEERNRALEHEPVLQEGDLIHATYTPQGLERILDHGLQCGEAVVDNARGQVNYPFTVSFLVANERVAAPGAMPERFDELKNDSYGPINLVMHRDPSSTDYNSEQRLLSGNQYQLFGGAPSTEIKGIIIRESVASADTVDGVIKTIVENDMFIPVYSGATGDLILSSEQYDQLRAQNERVQ